MNNLKIFTYKISSNCGTYFQPYTQRVTIVANDRVEADELFDTYIDRIKDSYLEVEESKFEVGIIDILNDTDY